MKKNFRKYTTSSTGFQYELICLSKSIIISLIGHLTIYDEITGYEFPIENARINWECFPENAALISDDVKEAACSFLKYCKLSAFW